jgi:hypothetical protein
MVFAGRVYIPHGWDELEANNNLASIKVGETTRQEVLHIMGKPKQHTSLNSESFLYSGGCSAGLLSFGGYYIPDCSPLENKWLIRISFDDNNIVSNIER